MSAYLDGIKGMRIIEKQKEIERASYTPDYLPSLAASGIFVSLRLASQIPHRHVIPQTGKKIIANNLRWFLSGQYVAEAGKTALVAQDVDGNEIPNFFKKTS